MYFYRQESADNEFDVFVRICTDYDSSDSRYYEFLTSYRQLCKEVADGCTRTLKEHGLFGCRAASFNHIINISNLIFLKAVGNNKEEWLSIWDSEHKDVPASDYIKELKLLEM